MTHTSMSQAVDSQSGPPSRAIQSGGLDSPEAITAATPEPELRLMATILEDAMTCFVRYADATSSAAKRQYRGAERWLFGAADDWIFSFESICAHLGVDPGFVRGQLRASLIAQQRNRAQSTP